MSEPDWRRADSGRMQVHATPLHLRPPAAEALQMKARGAVGATGAATESRVWLTATSARVAGAAAALGLPLGGLLASVITWVQGDTRGLVAFTLIVLAGGSAFAGLVYAFVFRPRLELRPNGTILVRQPIGERVLALAGRRRPPEQTGLCISLRGRSPVVVWAVQTSLLDQWWHDEPRGNAVAREILRRTRRCGSDVGRGAGTVDGQLVHPLSGCRSAAGSSRPHGPREVMAIDGSRTPHGDPLEERESGRVRIRHARQIGRDPSPAARACLGLGLHERLVRAVDLGRSPSNP